MSLRFHPALLFACSLLLATSSVSARPSLSGIDAKLDQLIAGQNAVAPTNVVTLLYNFNSQTACNGVFEYRIVERDGNVSNVEYEVPAGHTLFITDLQFVILDSTLRAGPTLHFGLQLKRDGQLIGQPIYQAEPVSITTENLAGRIGISENVKTPVVVPEDTTLCAVASTQTSTGFATREVGASVLRGILLPNAPE